MTDINLLPEDLKKKNDKNSAKSDNFDLDEIEFTEGEKIEKEIDTRIKVPKKNKIGKWFKPKFDNFSSSKDKKDINKNKNYNQVKSDIKSPSQDYSTDNNQKKEQDKSIPLQKKIKRKDSKKENKKLLKKRLNLEKIDKKKNALKGKKEKKKERKERKEKKQKSKKRKNSFWSIFKKKKEEKKDSEFDVNLLPFGSNIPTARRMLSILLIAFILSTALVFIAYFGYSVYKKKIVKTYDSLEGEIVAQSQSIKEYDNFIDEIEDWKVKIKNIQSFVDRHIYWTLFFERLEEYILSEVELSGGFAGSIDNTITFGATAPDYQTVSKQWILLEESEDFVDNVIIDSISLTDGKEKGIFVSFSLSLDFKEGVFLKNRK